DLEQALQRQSEGRVTRVRGDVFPSRYSVLSCQYSGGSSQPDSLSSPGRGGKAVPATRWSIKVDRVGFLDALEDTDLADVDEVVIDIARDHPTLLTVRLEHWAVRVGRDRVRLALPALTRGWEDRGLRHKIDGLRGRGWGKWEVANLSGWGYL